MTLLKKGERCTNFLVTRMKNKKVLLVDVDSKIPNLALMKLSAYHKSKGDEVGFNVNDPDKVYASIIFKKHAISPIMLRLQYPDAEVVIGGCGQDLSLTLPDEVEYIKPDYTLYDMDYSMGFTTRGCIRNCYFCIVPKKEGMIRINQHPKEFHDERFNKIIMLDNNILAKPNWFFEITDWFIKNDLKIDFNQGMDIRLLTKDIAERLYELKRESTWKFAFDSIESKKEVIRGIDLLKDAGINTKQHLSFYVYCHDNSMFEEALERCNILRERRCNSFVMFNIDNNDRSHHVRNLQRWANRRFAYWRGTFDEYVNTLSIERRGLNEIVK